MTTPSPLSGTITRELYRGDTRIWVDLIEENTGTDIAPVWTPKNLTGYTFRSQLRSDPDAATVLATITVEFVTDGTDGLLRSTLTAAEAAKLTPGRVAYDLEATRTSDGYVHTYLAGRWKVLADVSRSA